MRYGASPFGGSIGQVFVFPSTQHAQVKGGAVHHIRKRFRQWSGEKGIIVGLTCTVHMPQWLGEECFNYCFLYGKCCVLEKCNSGWLFLGHIETWILFCEIITGEMECCLNGSVSQYYNTAVFWKNWTCLIIWKKFCNWKTDSSFVATCNLHMVEPLLGVYITLEEIASKGSKQMCLRTCTAFTVTTAITFSVMIFFHQDTRDNILIESFNAHHVVMRR